MPTAVSTLDDLLREVVDRSASDLHLKPARPPLLRVHGELEPSDHPPLTPAALAALVDPVIPDRLRDRLREEMAIEFGYSLTDVSRFRASVFIQRGSRAAVFRRVPIDFPGLEDWGLPPTLASFGELPQGLVLITGPTGSGKSSALAAILRQVAATRSVHVVTIEDPIEFLILDDRAAISQREVGTDTPSYAIALRNALRQDPDVIMVGEMRDSETIRTVLTAAETGHLVFSTLHTNGAVQTVDRILDSFAERSHRQVRQQLAAVLEAVVSLQLVPRRDGSGMVAAVEILRRTPRVSKLIFKGELEAVQEEIESSVAYHKMQSMNQSLAALVLHGTITKETALARSANPSDLDLCLRRFLFAAEPQDPHAEEGSAVECTSDYSKILELQEIKKLYDELQERHLQEVGERDREIAALRERLEAGVPDAVPAPPGPGADKLLRENQRLAKQLQLVRLDYEGKLDRLNARLRELSGKGAVEATVDAGERRGFFRR
jgi:twitching motility protein PilT